MTYTITVPDVPPSLNKVLRMHWTSKAKLNSKWDAEIFVAAPKFFPIGKMRVIIKLHHSRLYDKDNAYGAVKPVVDALVSTGLLKDDTCHWLELTVEQVKSTRKDKRTVIEIGPAEAA